MCLKLSAIHFLPCNAESRISEKASMFKVNIAGEGTPRGNKTWVDWNMLRGRHAFFAPVGTVPNVVPVCSAVTTKNIFY